MGKTSRRFLPTGAPGGFPGDPPVMPPPGSYGTGGKPTGGRSPYADDPRLSAYSSASPPQQPPQQPQFSPGGGGGCGNLPFRGAAIPPYGGAVPPQPGINSPHQFPTPTGYPPPQQGLPYGVTPDAQGGGGGLYPSLMPQGPYPSADQSRFGSLSMPEVPGGRGAGGYPAQPGMNPGYPGQ